MKKKLRMQLKTLLYNLRIYLFYSHSREDREKKIVHLCRRRFQCSMYVREAV